MPSPALPAFDLTNRRDLIGLYVMVPVQKYPRFKQNDNHIGWPARIVGFANKNKKVRLAVKGDKSPAKHNVKEGPWCLLNLIRLA